MTDSIEKRVNLILQTVNDASAEIARLRVALRDADAREIKNAISAISILVEEASTMSDELIAAINAVQTFTGNPQRVVQNG